jgi:hypothetical protein
MAISLKKMLFKVLHKDLLLDLDDRTTAEALKAFEMVRDRAGLDKKRSRELEGQARFRMMEQGFQEVCELHGGHLLDDGLIPRTDLKVFQPFMRFEAKGQGVILGLAAMPDPKAIPTKNKSRLAGVSLNFNLSPRLDFDGSGAKLSDIFVLFLVARDHERAGKIEEVAIGIISSNYASFLFYEPVDKFLSGLKKGPAPDGAPPKRSSTVKLKKKATPFVPPELPKTEEDEESGNN